MPPAAGSAGDPPAQASDPASPQVASETAAAGGSSGTAAADRPRIGVLALQGDVSEHLRALERAGAAAHPVRHAAELDGLDGLVIPGGESTTIGALAAERGLMAPLRAMIAADRPVWGTCAGLILLARDVGRAQPLIGGLDITVERNAFGRQVDSFETDLEVAALGDGPFRAVFIRAPAVTAAGPDVEVLAALDDGTVVAVRQGRRLGTAFHPELTEDDRLHAYFVDLVRAARSSGAP